MEKNELIKLWAEELDSRLAVVENEVDAKAAIEDVLGGLYDVGFEAGKDAQKLEVQLNRKPTEEPISNTEPGAI